MGTIREKLANLSKGKISKWSKESEKFVKNFKWLQYSGNIAVRILSALEDKNWKQETLAGKLKVKPQRISKIVKGSVNLTLQTIANISEVLEIELISFPQFKYSFIQSQITTSWIESVQAINEQFQKKLETHIEDEVYRLQYELLAKTQESPIEISLTFVNGFQSSNTERLVA